MPRPAAPVLTNDDDMTEIWRCPLSEDVAQSCAPHHQDEECLAPALNVPFTSNEIFGIDEHGTNLAPVVPVLSDSLDDLSWLDQYGTMAQYHPLCHA